METMKKNIGNILLICASVFFGAVIVKYKSYFGGISWNAIIIAVCTPVISAVAIWILNRVARAKDQSQPVEEKKQQVQILILMYFLVAFYLLVRVFLTTGVK